MWKLHENEEKSSLFANLEISYIYSNYNDEMPQD